MGATVQVDSNVKKLENLNGKYVYDDEGKVAYEICGEDGRYMLTSVVFAEKLNFIASDRELNAWWIKRWEKDVEQEISDSLQKKIDKLRGFEGENKGLVED